ncbi:MAG: hypothetical protein LC723_02535, partial [Actinobacteria bacterium]|nr:hypothetical protein [Actinomycetota bacterium]
RTLDEISIEHEPETEPVAEVQIPEPVVEPEPEPEPEPVVEEAEAEFVSASVISDEYAVSTNGSATLNEDLDAITVDAVATIAEEVSNDRGDFSNLPISRLFAELSLPAPGPDVTTIPSQASSPQQKDNDYEEEEPAATVVTSSQPRPVDPEVDTSALLRELSGIGDSRDAANNQSDLAAVMGSVSSSPAENPSFDKDDKARGIFGKRRR